MKMDVKDLIRRRRRQLLVHSCLYYEMDNPIIEDYLYDKWSKELADLQEICPDYSDEWDQWFDTWTGETGMHLPHRHPWVFSMANHILYIYNRE